MHVVDMKGETIGRLYVVGRAPRPEYGTSTAAMWHCRCECGSMCVVSGRSLRRRLTQSCGCLRSEIIRASNARRRHTKPFSK